VLFFDEIKLQYSQNGQKLGMKKGQTNWGEIEDQLLEKKQIFQQYLI